MAKETLFCKVGNHKFIREAKRGRKPRFCPKHQPIVEVQVEYQTLVCAHDGHEWQRPRTKGKAPKFCPNHRPEAVLVMQTLTCAHDGHTWERPRTKGKVPNFCPIHKPQKTAQARVGSSGIPKIDFDDELVLAILDDSTTELSRKVNYIKNEFQNPRESRTVGDWQQLHYTFKRLLQEGARYLNRSVQIDIPLLEEGVLD